MKRVILSIFVFVVCVTINVAQTIEQLNNQLINAINNGDIEQIIEYSNRGADLTQVTEDQYDEIDWEVINTQKIIQTLLDSAEFYPLIQIGELFSKVVYYSDSALYTTFRLFIADCYAKLQQLDIAEQNYLGALVYNENGSDTLRCHEKLYHFYKVTNQVGKASNECLLLYNYYKENWDADKYLYYWNDYGRLCIKAKKYDVANDIFMEVKATLESHNLTNIEQYYLTLCDIAELKIERNDYDGAVQILKQIQDNVDSGILGKECFAYGRHSYMWGALAVKYNLHDVAKTRLNNAIEALEKYDREDYYIHALLQLALMYWKQGNYEMSLEQFDKVRSSIKYYITSKEMFVRIDDFQGVLFMNKYPHKALEYCLNAVTFYGSDTIFYSQYVRALHNLALGYFSIGKYNAAIEIFEDILNSDKLAQIECEEVTTIYSSSAVAYDNLGNYERAEEQIEKAREWLINRASCYTSFEKFWYHAIYVTANDGLIKYHTGDMYGAYSSIHLALSYCDSVSINVDDIKNVAYNNLALIHTYWEEYDSALYYANNALHYYQINYPQSDRILLLCANMSYIYSNINQLDSSLYYAQKVIDLCEQNKIYGDAYLYALSNVGAVYGKMHNFEEANMWYEKALKLIEEIYGKEHSIYRDVLQNYAGNLWLDRKFEKSYLVLQQAVGVLQKTTLNNFNYLAEYQRKQYLDVLENKLKYEIPMMICSMYDTIPQSVELLYDTELFRKGLLLNSQMKMQRSIVESGDAALINIYRQYQALKTQVASVQMSEDSLSEYQYKINKLDKELVTKSKEYRQMSSPIKCGDIKSVLRENEVAIEFGAYYEFSDYQYDTDAILYALVLRKDYDVPQLVILSKSHNVAQIVKKTQLAYDFYSLGDSLYNLVWQPIERYLNKGDVVYYAPSDILYNVNISAIPCDSIQYLSDVYNLKRVSSTRELINDEHSLSLAHSILYGGIQYDIDTITMQQNSSYYASDDIMERAIDEQIDSLRAGVKYLPGTLKEVQQIEQLLNNKGKEVSLYTADIANEESFKALSGRDIDVLHIATHGFAFSNSKANKQKFFQSQILTPNQVKEQYIDPLKRTGLLLAGSNIAYTGHRKELPQGLQDGVLTAKEISILDLSSVELLVLSACETGLGDITADGVMGLQRAFKQAGVQTIIMSLWKVNDEATSYMMTTFYDYLLNGESKRAAFNHAQQKVREKYNDPYYWAAFVMID